MAEKVVIDLSSFGCAKATNRIKEIAKENGKKLDEVCKRLADIGTAEAKMRFDRAGDGNGGVTVAPVPITNGYKVSASGHDVYFIEFGTGHAAGINYYGDITKASVPVYPGSYSEQNTQEFVNYGSWHHDGIKYQQTEAEMPMYYAGKAIRENIKKVAKEIYK